MAMSGSSELPPETPRPSARMAERLAVIVDAAERAALAVIDDAEKEAERYLEEARGRADLVVAERLREEADRIERRAAAAAPPDSPEPPPMPPAPPTPPEHGEPLLRKIPTPEPAPPTPLPPQPVAAPVTPDEFDQARSEIQSAGGSAAARLLATQMAVSGSSREEIELRLRNGFEIEDTGEILDAILGPEAGRR